MKQFWQENKGSISTLAIFSIIAVLMILFLSINIGNIFAKKSLVEDTADGIAPILLSNQISRWIVDKNDQPSGYDDTIPVQDSIDGASMTTSVITQLEATSSTQTLSQASVTTVFGLWTPATQTFCAFGPPQGTEKDCLIAPSNKAISRTDPNLNAVILQQKDGVFTEEFAAASQIKYQANVFGSFFNVAGITLRGKAIAHTQYSKLPPPEDNPDCCCTWAGEQNNTTAKYKLISILPPWPFPACWVKEPGFDDKCNEYVSITKIFSEKAPTCIDYLLCKGNQTFFEHLYDNVTDGQLFSGFRDFLAFLACWYPQFKADLINTITTVSTNLENAWDGWT